MNLIITDLSLSYQQYLKSLKNSFLSQLLEYIDQKQMLQDTTSGYRKGHSTTSVLLCMTDDIIRAMKNGELTLITFADFSKAFETVEYSIVIRKLNALEGSSSLVLELRD